MCKSAHVYIYAHIIKTNINTYTHTHTHVYTFIYIYIYMYVFHINNSDKICTEIGTLNNACTKCIRKYVQNKNDCHL